MSSFFLNKMILELEEHYKGHTTKPRINLNMLAHENLVLFAYLKSLFKCTCAFILWAGYLNCDQSLHLRPYFVCTSSEDVNAQSRLN